MAKKFKDTKVGKFLSGSSIVDTLGSVLPDAGFLGIVKNLIEKQPMPVEDKEKALKLLELDQIELQEVTKRWVSDSSGNWLTKSVRPLTLIFLTLSMVILILLDSLQIGFNVDNEWINLLQSLMMTTFLAYFGGRSYEKTRK